jgi:hypothetical protein
VAVVVVWRVGEAEVSPPTTPVTSPREPSAQDLFQSLLVMSATARNLVEAAVAGPCGTASPESGARARLVAQIGQADVLYRQVVQDVQADLAVLSKMRAGRALSADLVRATDASIQAGTAYHAWLEDLQATGCYSAPTNDVHYRAATAASLAAGRAQEQMTDLWSKRENSPRAA